MHLLAGTISGSPSPSGFLLGALQFPFLCLKLESTRVDFCVWAKNTREDVACGTESGKNTL